MAGGDAFAVVVMLFGGGWNGVERRVWIWVDVELVSSLWF